MASYVAPGIKDKFETLSTDLKNLILERNVELNNMQDLIRVLEQIVEEGKPSNHGLPFSFMLIFFDLQNTISVPVTIPY